MGTFKLCQTKNIHVIQIFLDMISSLESFSTELLFEVFEYLSPYELFRSWINLNHRLNTIVYSYPLHLNFRLITRLEFDYICSHLQPKQVISLILSDETISHQVNIFKQYFPFFKQQFIHLQSLTLIQLFDDKIDLPISVKSLEIRKYDIYENFGFNFDQLLEQQAKVLTHLKVDRIGILNYINTQFPALTHLIIDGGFSPDVNYVKWTDQYVNVDASSIFQRIKSPITHLYLFIDQENQNMKINLQQFSHCLTHLTLHFFEDIVVSYQSLEQCLKNLHQLTHLTLQASGKNDLIDGNQWKNFLLKTNISKFNFKFRVSNHHSGSTLLESFRSPFWIKQKHCYVGYNNIEEIQQTCLFTLLRFRSEQICLFTLPRFRSKHIVYPSLYFPYITTAPLDIQQNFLYERIDSLEIDSDKFIIPPIHRFTQVKLLICSGSVLMSVDILRTILDFNQVEVLDVSCIELVSRHELNKLIKHLPRLNSLMMKYNPLFVIPSQIHTLNLEDRSKSISIDNLCHTIKNVKSLAIPIDSEDMMLDIIDQLDHINDFRFMCHHFSQSNYLEFFIEKLCMYWMENNSYRLTMNHFTFRQGEEYQHIQMSIGGPKTDKYSDYHTFPD
jgi:hypothetical protein